MAESRSRPVSMRVRAADLARAGRHAAAIDLATTALSQTGLSPAAQIDLLDLRAESRVAIGRFDAAHDDALVMQSLADAAGKPSLAARALCRMALVQTRQGAFKLAAETAQRALAAARRARDRGLVAMAQYRLAEASWRAGDEEAGLRAAQRASTLFERLGDTIWHGRSLWSQACAFANLGRSTERERAAGLAMGRGRVQVFVEARARHLRDRRD